MPGRLLLPFARSTFDIGMKAFLVTEPHRYALREVAVPDIGENDLLLRVGACGICGSDLDILEGARPMEVTRYPLISGHEFSGEVVEAGRAVRGYRPGEKVAVDTLVSCRQCRHCQMGWTAHCLNGFRQLGCTDPGGLAEYVAVPQQLAYKLSEQSALTDAALAEPASCAAHGVRKAGIRPGQSVVVVGAGPIGALALQVARLFSPGHLILVEVDERKLKAGRKLGASVVIDARNEDVATRVLEITKGRGADAIIECTGAVEPIQQSFSYVATKGRIVVIGVPARFRFEIDYLPLLLRDATFRASNGYTTEIWIWVLELLSRGFFDTGTIITHQIPLVEIDRGFQILQTRSECALKVMIIPSQGKAND
jgi:2-desacetyl-2-hydroxyethyl bacteriochlorophyllide A dehydrogenase